VSGLHPPAPGTTAVALVDGEHYPMAVADVLRGLQERGWSIPCVALLGGTEKLRGEPDYGIPHVTGDGAVDAVRQALAAHDVECVLDLADEPVLVFEQRARVIAFVAGRGVRYVGADTVVTPPLYEAVSVPSLAVIGTGKRIGKTAVSAHVARVADRALGGDGDVVVVAMGRGGPAEPVVVDRAAGPIGVERLLELSRGGAHAASDYLEDAALTGLTTIGCRRVGGGLLGVPAQSNVPEGARIAEGIGAALTIFEGSGSSLPPVITDRTLLLAAASRPQDLLDGFGPYRLERADMLLVVGDDIEAAARMCAAARELRPGLHARAASLRPVPVSPVRGLRVAGFTTAPAVIGPILEMALLKAGAAAVPVISTALARRDELRADVDRALEAGCDCFAVEIKAAAIDVVAEAAARHGIDVVWVDNRPVTHDARVDLDEEFATLALAAAGRGQPG